MRLLIERWYPLVIGLVAWAIYIFTPSFRDYKMPATLPSLLSAMVSIGGIAVGFLATAKSILVSIDEKEIVKKLKKAGYYRRIISYLRSAIRWSFLLTVLSGAGMLIDFASAWEPWKASCFGVWLGVAVVATISYYRVVSLFYGILAGLE